MASTLLSPRPTPTGFAAVVARGVRVLVAVGDPLARATLAEHLSGHGFTVRSIDDGLEALRTMRGEAFDVAVLEHELPRLGGLDVLRALQGETLAPQVVLLTGNDLSDGLGDGLGDAPAAALRLGAYDYVAKPYHLPEIVALVRRAWEKRRLLLENATLRNRVASLDGDGQFIAAHPSIIALRDSVGRAAQSDEPVLFAGEPGTGKALLARALHRRSARARGLFVRVDCLALRDAEERLFGADGIEGASSAGAAPGIIEESAGGTLFCAEIGALAMTAQRRLGDALSAGTFRRLRGSRDLSFAPRIVASTSRVLGGEIERGRFDASLFERLAAITITTPPLRERLVDLPLLAEQILVNRAGAAAPRLGGDALAAMSRYAWPGNVRELRVVLERAALLASDGEIHARDLALPGAPIHGHPAGDARTLVELEREHIVRVLERVEWHQGRAASILGISSKTLYRKIREYGFQRPIEASEDE